MPRQFARIRFAQVSALALLTGGLSLGCAHGPTYNDHWNDAQQALLQGEYGPARTFLEECERVRPRRIETMHDMGVCSMMIAREKFEQMNHAAAMRELDRAIACFDSAIDDVPGHQASLEGKNRALELKGQFQEALKHTEWAATFVGPSARQYIFLARELDERGDKDAALLRYQQAISMEPDNAEPHVAIAQFYLRTKNEPAAIRHLQAAYDLNPKDAWVHEQLSSRGALPQMIRTTKAPSS
jgi:tetratricopeptide (TPR) repeat protein